MGLNSLLSGHAGRLFWPVMHLFYMLLMVESDTRSEKEIRKSSRASVPMIGPTHQLLVALSTVHLPWSMPGNRSGSSLPAKAHRCC